MTENGSAVDPFLPVSTETYPMGRFLRAVAACDEGILRYCVGERFKFSGLGAVIIGTATLAALSMTEGLATVFGMPFRLMVPFGLVWGGFILALDRWLVATGKGVRHYLPRVFLAAMLGIVVAEPFVLRIFGDAIEQRVFDDNSAALERESEQLNDCNPVIENPLDPATSPEGCGEHLLPIERPTTPVIPEVPEDLATTEADLRDQLDALEDELAAERQATRDEADGVAGPGNSGIPGIGPFTEARREAVAGLEVDVERKEEQLAPVLAEIEGIRSGAREATEQAEIAAAAYNANRDAAIAQKLEERENQLSAEPRFARRWIALLGLIADQPALLIARIFLSFFFIAIDISPVLVKMSTSGGTYDRLVSIRAARAIDRARVDQAIEKEQNQARLRERQNEIRHQIDMVEQDFAAKRRLELSRIDHDINQEIDRQEREFLAARASTNGS